MDPNLQLIFDALIVALFGLLGFIGNLCWSAIKELRLAHLVLIEKITDLQVLVAGDYVKKSDLDRAMQHHNRGGS